MARGWQIVVDQSAPGPGPLPPRLSHVQNSEANVTLVGSSHMSAKPQYERMS